VLLLLALQFHISKPSHRIISIPYPTVFRSTLPEFQRLAAPIAFDIQRHYPDYTQLLLLLF
jgi:hypothetical protein